MFAWEDYSQYRISPVNSSDLRHAELADQLQSLQSLHPESGQITRLGESAEGRSISMLTLGNGPKQVLAWSQMHGNEPTHTAALLDLISFLLQAPEHPTAIAILGNCQLHLILMLNPDGAQRWTRRNAQDIDINRDALLVQSPEAQILRRAVETLQPDFALNLHNHRPHTTAGDSKRPASFALLAPPIDFDESETPNVRQAKQLAGYVAGRVAPYCPGPVSRYDADFMPRCFGEWVQQQGAATITVEAGGWSTAAAEPLVQLHFYGLVACLEAIATESFLEVAPTIYDTLPRTGEHDLFDLLLQDVTVLNGRQPVPFRADLGINFSQTMPTVAGGKIVDLGDLRVTGGRSVSTEANLLCTPGRFAWLTDVTPRKLCDQKTVAALLAEGVTTVLGQVNLAEAADVAELETLHSHFASPLNLGFLAKLTQWSPALLDRLLKAISLGIVGVLADGLPPEVQRYLSWFDFPVIPEQALPTANEQFATVAQCASRTQQCAHRLALHDRGSIVLGSTADLILLRTTPPWDAASPLSDSHLQRVIVAGNVVFEAGNAKHVSAGELLSRRITCS